MYTDVALINRESDKKVKVSPLTHFKYANALHQSIITASEIFEACRSFPVVFGKNNEGEFFMTAILGLKEEKNLFVDTKGVWKEGEYIPAYIRRYPFIFVSNGESLSLGIDRASGVVNTKKGEALFTTEGEPTEYLKTILAFMEHYQRSYQSSADIVKELDTLGLLETVDFEAQGEKGNFALRGIMRVNEEKLGMLDAMTMQSLVERGIYKMVIAHLISLGNLNKLLVMVKKEK